MPQVTVTIDGKTYRMACDDGQEEHLFGLAKRLDATIEELRSGFGEIGDQRLTVMSAITVLDQLSESERRLNDLQAEVTTLRAFRDQASEVRSDAENRLAERVVDAAERIERLAESLNKPAS